LEITARLEDVAQLTEITSAFDITTQDNERQDEHAEDAKLKRLSVDIDQYAFWHFG
jgi:hypothetical protein